MAFSHPPARRLRTRAEFDAVQRRGRRISARFATVLALPNSLAHDRLGVIASRRVGTAVRRNLAKRRLREIFRTETPGLAASGGGADIVVVARADLARASFAEVRTDVMAAIRKCTSRTASRAS